MNNKPKLTKRDKILIYFCALFVFAAGTYWFAIMPCLNLIADYNEKNNEAYLEMTEKTEMSGMLKIYRDTNATARSDYEKLVSKYNGAMDYEDMDRLLTGMITDCSMKPVSLSFSEPVKEIPMSYYEALFGEEMIIEEDFSEDEEGEEGESEEDVVLEEEEETTDISTYPIVLEFSGNLDGLKKLTDKINSTKSMRVTGFSVAPAGDDFDYINEDVPQELDITMTVEIYTYQKSE